MNEKKLQKLSDVNHSILTEYGYDDLLVWVKLQKHLFLYWELIVGIPLAEKTFPYQVRKKELLVFVQDANYSSQLRWYQQQILGYLEAFFQGKFVEKIRFVVREFSPRLQWKEKLYLRWKKIIGSEFFLQSSPLKVERETLCLGLKTQEGVDALKLKEESILEEISKVLGKGLLTQLQFEQVEIPQETQMVQKLFSCWKDLVQEDIAGQVIPCSLQNQKLTLLLPPTFEQPLWKELAQDILEKLQPEFEGWVKQIVFHHTDTRIYQHLLFDERVALNQEGSVEESKWLVKEVHQKLVQLRQQKYKKISQGV